MKTKVFFTLLLFCCFLFGHAQKITGYLYSYWKITPVTKIQYDKLPDIVFAFNSPNLTEESIQNNLKPFSNRTLIVLNNLGEGVVELKYNHGLVISTMEISDDFSELEFGEILIPEIYQMRV